jgi:hypothetical protein
VGSGAAFITHTLYRMMFNGPMPDATASYLPNDQALIKLITDKSVDVAVVAAGQPAPIIANMKPEAQKFIKLLKFDPGHPTSKQAMKIYSPATVWQNLPAVKEDFTTISVGAFLVTCDYTLQGTVEHLTGSRELCQQFPELQTKGHPKWREVDLSLPPLNDGWTCSPTAKELRNCRRASEGGRQARRHARPRRRSSACAMTPGTPVCVSSVDHAAELVNGYEALGQRLGVPDRSWTGLGLAFEHRDASLRPRCHHAGDPAALESCGGLRVGQAGARQGTPQRQRRRVDFMIARKPR